MPLQELLDEQLSSGAKCNCWLLTRRQMLPMPLTMCNAPVRQGSSEKRSRSLRNDVVPRARGEEARLPAEAEAYREEVVSRAEGDASRFDQVYNAYEMDKNNP